MPTDLSPEVSILAVETNIFPLYEVEDGVRYAINHEPRRLPVQEYLSKQGRFRHLKEAEIKHIQNDVDGEWEKLKYRATLSPHPTLSFPREGISLNFPSLEPSDQQGRAGKKDATGNQDRENVFY